MALRNFHGQASPEVPIMQLDDLDEPLFQALLDRWKRHHLGKRQRWQDRALFRSLNMEMQAAQLPAGMGTTLYDLGRIAARYGCPPSKSSPIRAQTSLVSATYIRSLSASSILTGKSGSKKYICLHGRIQKALGRAAFCRAGSMAISIEGATHFCTGIPLARKRFNRVI